MKILWTHNFSPDVANSGVFMKQIHSQLKQDNINIEMMYLGNLRSLFGLIKAIIKVRNTSESFDIVHAQFGSACAFVSMFAKCKKILSLRGSDIHRYEGLDFKTKLHNFLSRTFTKIAINNYDQIIVMSKRMKNEINKIGSNVTSTIIPDPIDLELFKPSQNSKKIGKKYILFTTLDIKNSIKRTDLAVNAVNLAKKTVPDIELKIASGLKHKEMPSFIQQCSLALCTSYYEGWPNCIKEAIACGIPFVSTDVSDLADIAKRNTSCIIANDTATDISEAIIEALKRKPNKKLSEEVSGMSLTLISKKLLSIYDIVSN